MFERLSIRIESGILPVYRDAVVGTFATTPPDPYDVSGYDYDGRDVTFGTPTRAPAYPAATAAPRRVYHRPVVRRRVTTTTTSIPNSGARRSTGSAAGPDVNGVVMPGTEGTDYGSLLDPVLGWIGVFPYAVRLLLCFLLIAPPSFLMGFPMPTAMTTLGRLGKDHMFLWAWGINGCFSVIGAALVPIVATTFGLSAVLATAGAAYLLALPSFFAVLLPRSPHPA